MSLLAVIAGFNTGTYVVTRAAVGSFTTGLYTPGATSTLNVPASVQPASGRVLRALREGQHADDVRTMYTATELKTRTPTTEPDLVAIDGETFEVFHVKRYQVLETYYRVLVSRITLP